MKELFTKAEVAAAFGVTYRTVLKWERRGILKPTLYLVNRPRYAVEDIEKLVTLGKEKTQN